MYIEISPRQSGKTTRIIQEVIRSRQDYKQSDISFIVTCNKGLKERIFEKIKLALVDIYNCEIVIDHTFSTIEFSNSGVLYNNSISVFDVKEYFEFCDLSKKSKVYLDEFDFFGNDLTQENKDYFLSISDNLYCYTTPSKTRTISEIFDENSKDLFCKLLQENNWYKKYPIPKNTTNIVRWMNDERYCREILGEFLEKDNYREFIENYHWQTGSICYLFIDTRKNVKEIKIPCCFDNVGFETDDFNKDLEVFNNKDLEVFNNVENNDHVEDVIESNYIK